MGSQLAQVRSTETVPGEKKRGERSNSGLKKKKKSSDWNKKDTGEKKRGKKKKKGLKKKKKIVQTYMKMLNIDKSFPR